MILSIILIAILLFGDQALKYYVCKTMSIMGKKEIIPNVLTFQYVENTGAGFSMMSGQTLLLAILSLVCSIIIAYFLFKSNWKKKKVYSIAMVLIFSGCVGNLFDRFYASIPDSGRAGVVDMIIFEPLDMLWNAIFHQNFAIWNLADGYLVIGVILLCVHVLFLSREERK